MSFDTLFETILSFFTGLFQLLVDMLGVVSIG